jgi:glycosyltransferase involved in cell wall biosynthesis
MVKMVAEIGRYLRVCYFGTYRANYSRNQIMIEGLRRNGIEVIECHVPLWQGIEDRVEAASGGWLRLAFIVRVIRTYWNLLRAYQEIDDYDIMVLGYPGQLDVYLARILTWSRRKPLVLDVFMSIYLIAAERGLTDKHPITARLIYWLEKMACLLPDLLIIDTAEYVQWFQETYNLDPDRFRLVPTGADDRIFHPVETERPDDGLFRVVYYGTFIPNHGVKYIVEAARILQDEPDIHFELIGKGPTKAEAVALAEKYDLENVTFVDWVDRQDLPRRVAKADICLGVFGTTPQSMMTVQNKIYEGLAMGKCVVTGDSPTVRKSLADQDPLCLCERADPQSLVDTVLKLKAEDDLRHHLSEEGHRLFLTEFNLQSNGARYISHLCELFLNNSPCS